MKVRELIEELQKLPQEVKEFKVVQADDLYDPNDNATIIAHHGSEHIFTNNGLYVNQWLEWVGEHVLSNTFLAMHLPSKSVTNKFYTDRDYNVRDTISGSDIVVKKAKKASVYNADGSCNTECSVVKYPSGLKGGDIFTMFKGKCDAVIIDIANEMFLKEPNDGKIWKYIM